MQQYDLKPLLEHIPCASVDYSEWVKVGMALHAEGYPLEVWDEWSRADSRYKQGECQKKWKTFGSSSEIVAGGTIFELAKSFGWTPADSQKVFDWDDEISYDGNDPSVIIKDKAWVEAVKIDEAKGEDKQELITYLETLFKHDECVGFVMQSRMDDDKKYKPASSGKYTFTAGQLIDMLKKNDTIEDALEKYDHAGGAWIRFNPLDGGGIKNDNVSSFRFALVESDNMSVDEQYGLYKELNLPIAALVSSAGKSLHAIVRIDAFDKEEYRKRVDYLYEVCEKNGIVIDKQNKNPSRLSRMPGVVRHGTKRQALIATNIGASDYFAWVDWLNDKSDDLPLMDNLDDMIKNPPPLAPELISGVLRKGHKLLLAGPSKAGKSFMLMNLAICIAEGRPFLGLQCMQGKVLYINMEIDKATCIHRFADIYKLNEMECLCASNIDIWNLRGKAVPMDVLAPRLIHRAAKKGYIAIILDPLYKVITGDENNASDMAKFCNQFDRICSELECSLIYCHHHSKGAQGHKSAIDRASGSGVFARDPDALLDLMEINPKDVGYTLPEGATSAWRMSFTLREFPPMKSLETVFRYPVHEYAEGLEGAGEKYGADEDVKRKRSAATRREQKQERVDGLLNFIENWDNIREEGGHKMPKISDALKYFEGQEGYSETSIKRWAKDENAKFEVQEGGYLFIKDDING